MSTYHLCHTCWIVDCHHLQPVCGCTSKQNAWTAPLNDAVDAITDAAAGIPYKQSHCEITPLKRLYCGTAEAAAAKAYAILANQLHASKHDYTTNSNDLSWAACSTNISSDSCYSTIPYNPCTAAIVHSNRRNLALSLLLSLSCSTFLHISVRESISDICPNTARTNR